MKILRTFRVPKKAGEVGIEIEVEGNALPVDGVLMWNCERDGSLRGEAVEYVLKTPCPREDIPHVMGYLTSALKKAGAEIQDSGRAGVHIHINVQELEMKEVINFVCLYLIFEQSLVNYCGESRVGNLFCLRANDAGGMVTTLRKACQSSNWNLLATDRVRYAALNVRALTTYGSLEFRAMRSTTDPLVIEEWAKLLLTIKDAARGFDNPQQVVEALSTEGAENMFYRIFGFDTPLVYSYGEVMEGVRIAQHLAYCRDEWDEPDELEVMRTRAGRIHRHYDHAKRLTRYLSSSENFYDAGVGHVEQYVSHYINWKENHLEEDDDWELDE